MVDLFILSMSLAAGVPGGIYLDKKIREIKEQLEHSKQMNEIKERLTSHFNGDVKFERVYGGDWGYWSKASTEQNIFKLQARAKELGAKFRYTENDGLIIRCEYVKEFEEFEEYQYIPLKPHELLIGYNNLEIISVDMIKCPHLLVTGLSGQGKTGMIKVMLKNIRGADIVLLNGFDDDFKEFRHIRKIKGEKEILLFLTSIYENLYKRERPLYLVIEELATIKDKKLNSIIQELLCVARHYNIYIVGIIQIATKEELKFKSYFNARCTFKQLEDASYRVALGCGIEEGLNKREFYLFTDGLYKGTTFTL